MATTTKLTYAAYESFPDDGNRYEIIDGQVFVSPPPITPHQWASAELTWHIGDYVRRHDLGRVFYAPYAVRLGPHDVFEPDVLFISQARMSLVDRRGVNGAPDICIEITSPSSLNLDRRRKHERYAYFGVPEYWIVDPNAKTVEVFRLENGASISLSVSRDDDRVISHILPGLELRASALFTAQWDEA